MDARRPLLASLDLCLPGMQNCMVLPSWDDIRVFLAVARAGTLAAAARTLDVDYTTVGRRVRALEGDLGITLFERLRDRFVLTEAAERLRESAERMEE